MTQPLSASSLVSSAIGQYPELTIERVIGTIRREHPDHTPFWNSLDLARKLDDAQVSFMLPLTTDHLRHFRSSQRVNPRSKHRYRSDYQFTKTRRSKLFNWLRLRYEDLSLPLQEWFSEAIGRVCSAFCLRRAL